LNAEFSTPAPDVGELQARLTLLLAREDVVALLIGEPAKGVAVLCYRPSVW